MRIRLAVSLQLLLSLTSLAATRPPAFRNDAYNYTDPRRLASHAESLRTPDITLDVPAPHRLGGDPPQNGIVRSFLHPYEFPGSTRRAVSHEAGAEADEPVAVFRSAGASRVRLHLTNLQLADAVRLTVSGVDSESVSFGLELQQPEGGLWTPSVAGDTIALSAPASARFSVAEIAHIFAAEPTSTSCFTDVSCNTFSDRDALSTAVAQMIYVRAGGTYVCTGGLINGPDGDRLFLTANHCIPSQSEASSLELTWDLRTASCGGLSTPNTKRTNGATLLVTSAATDVTLLRLNSLPAGRWLMGWTTGRPAAGTTLYRISHPYDDVLGLFPQVYSTTTVSESTTACTALPRPNYLYSLRSVGGIAGGSSGSPVITQGGYIVGQLFGLCGPDPLDGCFSTSKLVDGSLGQSYAALRPYLDPEPTQCASCTPGNTTACALGNRFKITLTWRDQAAGLSGSGSIVRYTENTAEVDPKFGPVSESIFLSLYSFAPKSVEVLVRMLNGHGINDKYWIFLTGFTGAEYTVVIQDTRTCATWQRTVTAGATNVVKDFAAFPLP